MPTVQPFRRSMIEVCLKQAGLKFLTDNDGDFRVMFGHDSDLGCSLDFLLMAGGSQSEIFCVIASTDKRVPRSDWGRAVMVCNLWNKDRRWPKAYLNAGGDDHDQESQIILEYMVDLENGVHQELLDSMIKCAMASSMAFWQWAHQEQGL